MRAAACERACAAFTGNGGGFSGRAWRRRFFRLDGRHLFYFKSDQLEEPLGQFSITYQTVVECACAALTRVHLLPHAIAHARFFGRALSVAQA